MNNIKIDEKNLVVQYHKKRLGGIAQFYKKEDSDKYFYYVIDKLKKRYPRFIDEKKDFDLLTGVGRVITMDLLGKDGIYNSEDKNIGINHFLNRITTAFFHECVHKLSDLRNRKEFKNLPRIYIELGTELVTIESLKKNDGMMFLFDDLWGILPNTSTEYKPELLLVKQLGTLVSDECLEKTILQGSNEFFEEMISVIGRDKFESITKKIESVSKKRIKYTRYYGVEKEEKNRERQQELKVLINEIQDEILDLKFKKCIDDVNTPEEAKRVLEELLEFSNLRLRRFYNSEFHDEKFEKYFYAVKGKFENKFEGFYFEKKLDLDDWQRRYRICPKVEQISKDELDIVKLQAEKMRRRYNSNIFDRLFRRSSIDEPKLLNVSSTKITIFEDDGFKFKLDIQMLNESLKERSEKDVNDVKSQDVK